MIRVVLKDIVEKPITGEWGDEGTSVNVLRTTNFTNEGFIDYTKVVKRDIEQKKIDTKRLYKGDIIIEKSGGSPTQPVGRVVYFDSEEIYLCNNFTAILRPKKEQVYPKYLHYILFVGHQFGLTSAFQNKTTGIINLQLPKYLEGVQVPLPPLPQQQKIANILDAADALRQNDKALIAKYDELTQALFLDMFGDININNKKWTIIKLGALFKDKKDLVDGPFGSSVNTKVDYVENGEIPVVRTKNVSINNEFITKDLKFMTREKYNTVIRSQVLPGDIILTKVGTIGNVCIFPSTYSEAVLSTTGSCRMRVNTEMINKAYFIQYLNLYKPKMLEIASAGVQAFLNMVQIKGFNIMLPPISLQNQFAKRVAVIEEQKAIAQKSLEHSESLFNSLLQKAFKGELV